MELAFQFPDDRSLCLAMAATQTWLPPCHNHFQICGYQGDTLEQEGDGSYWVPDLNPFKTELNPICHLLALLGTHHILHVSRVRANNHKFQSDDGTKTAVI